MFDFYLRVEHGLKPGSVLICIIYLQKVVRIALRRNLISRPPFMGYKPERPELQPRSLTKDELERIISSPIESINQCLIRDLFVFASFTGISYADLKNLTWKNIITEEDGSLWISMSRQKTGVPFNVKLLDIPIRIMEKYRGLAKDGHIFPVLGQGRINCGLKHIAKQCKITTPLTFHMSRFTFATTVCLTQGAPIESLSQMMGHLSIKTTQIYAEVTRTKINEDMTNLEERKRKKFSKNACGSVLPFYSRNIPLCSEKERNYNRSTFFFLFFDS